MDPLASVGAAFLAALTGRAKTLMDWLVQNLVSLTILTLFFGMLLESLPKGKLQLNPVDAAYRVADVFGFENTQWLDTLVSWLERPPLEPVAIFASLLAGLMIFWSAKYSDEAAWILLIASIVALGSRALLLLVWGFGGVTALLCVAAWVNTHFETTTGTRRWMEASYVLERALVGLVSWILTPFTLLFRVLNGVIDLVTYEDK